MGVDRYMSNMEPAEDEAGPLSVEEPRRKLRVGCALLPKKVLEYNASCRTVK